MYASSKFAPGVVSAALALLFIAWSSVTAATSEWHSLFDGKTLEGWQANESSGSWVVEGGAIVTRGERSHLFYVGDVANHDFKNFEFYAEVMTTPGSNSGIYIHTHLKSDPWPQTGYEAQVINSSRAKPDEYSERKMTASIYAVRNTWRAPAADNTWFEYRIKVSGKTIQTFINGELTCQYTEAPNSWRGEDKPGRYLSSGTFALQCHDPKSIIYYRNLKVRLLPDDTPSLDEPMADRELDELITWASDQNFALIDLGLAPGTAALIHAQSVSARFYGVTPGYTLAPGATDIAHLGADAPVVVINDRKTPPSVELMKAAKANGARIAFSSGGDTRIDPDRLRQRIKAIRAADLEWRDMWVP